ncbi:MAG: 30S ribosomal protein S17 [Phycisphaerae bacterium]|nr:30S ribosomal protein S17 [Phycisphaerae bacterium]
MTKTLEKDNVRKRRKLTGVVASTGGEKTIHIVVDNLVKHPHYGKYIRRRTKLAVHDGQSQAALGDTVEVVACRRLSKTKSWRLVRVVRPAKLTREPSAEKD